MDNKDTKNDYRKFVSDGADLKVITTEHQSGKVDVEVRKGVPKIDFELELIDELSELIDEMRQIKYYLKALAVTQTETRWSEGIHDNELSEKIAKGAIDEAMKMEDEEICDCGCGSDSDECICGPDDAEEIKACSMKGHK